MYPHRSYPDSRVVVVPGDTYHRLGASRQGRAGSYSASKTSPTRRCRPSRPSRELPNAKLASAEAIVEAPSGGGVLPLANFGTRCSSPSVTVNGASMMSPPADQITMVNASGGVKAQPSTLSGGAFSVTWQSTS